jgi:hypothetical protein
MTYVQTFGGELIFPSQTSYLAITTLVDVTLQWPIEQQIAGIDVVADFMDVDTGIGLNIDMPDARQASTGQKATFNNVGANLYTVRDAIGGTIQTVAIGEQWVFVLTDNTTEAGTWTVFQMGSSVSVATAGPLAGFGIKAIAATLNQQIESDVEAATPFTVVDSDRAKCLIYTTGTGTCNLPSPAAVGDDWFFLLRNSGTGTLNIVPPSGVIDDAASINLDPNDSCFIFTDGTDFFTVGLSTGSVIAFDFVSIAIPGSGDFTLSGANLNRISYRFTGLLTGNRKIVVPGTTQQYWVDNQTTGAFALTIGTSAQVGEPEITQGLSEIFYCDGVDVVNAVSATTVSIPVTIAQGGTSATTVAGAQTALQVPPTSRDMIAGVAMSGGGDLSADRTFDYAGGLNDQSDVTLTAPATGSVLFKSAGDWLDTDAIEIDPLGDVLVRNNAVPVATFGSVGFTYDIQQDVGHFLRVLNNQGGVRILINSSGGSGDGLISQISNLGGVEDTWIQLTRNGDVGLFFNGLEVLRTLIAASGGLEIDNQSTGGGFERVLTTSDVPAAISGTFISGLTAVSGNVNAEITEPHSLGGLPDIVQLVLECTTGELGYSVGDQVVMNPTAAGLDEASGIHQAYNQVAYDGTNIFYVIVDEATLGLSIPDRLNPGQPAFATLTSWSMLVKAIKF